MSDKTQEFRVTVTGPPLSVDQFHHLLGKLASEGERSGVDVTVERVETETADPQEFTTGGEV
jgi:hypothetical protein